MPLKNIKKKLGSVIEPQKVDQDPILGTTSNIDSGDQLSLSTMSISEQSTRDNEVSRPGDNKKVVARQPPLRPRSPMEPGQIREKPFVENESSPSSNGITVRSSPMANYAARKLEKSTALGTGPTVMRNNNDKEEENRENNMEVTEENDPGVPTVDNEGFNINTSAKPSTRHVYPNGKTFDKMLNDPRFVNIPGSTRNIGDKLEWADRVVGQMMRAHSMRDGQRLSVWHEQGIKFDSEGNPHHRGTPAGLEEIRPHSTQQEYGNSNAPLPRITQGTLVATGDHYPSDSSSSDSSNDSFDGYR
ncbi:hypothetical protein GGU11DRAFT_751501 [Lentinula aff. detonsa]|nr:hypothetical protein GGU11DRAFT_751501 [Lentinula aff. detonsa]